MYLVFLLLGMIFNLDPDIGGLSGFIFTFSPRACFALSSTAQVPHFSSLLA